MKELEKSFNSETRTWENIAEIATKHKYKSCTDTSKWKPNVKVLNTIEGATSIELDNSQFNFKDGKDTGERFYDITDPKLDVVERQEAYERLKSDFENDKAIVEEAFKNELSEIEKVKAEAENSNGIANVAPRSE